MPFVLSQKRKDEGDEGNPLFDVFSYAMLEVQSP